MNLRRVTAVVPYIRVVDLWRTCIRHMADSHEQHTHHQPVGMSHGLVTVYPEEQTTATDVFFTLCFCFLIVLPQVCASTGACASQTAAEVLPIADVVCNHNTLEDAWNV